MRRHVEYDPVEKAQILLADHEGFPYISDQGPFDARILPILLLRVVTQRPELASILC